MPPEIQALIDKPILLIAICELVSLLECRSSDFLVNSAAQVEAQE